MKNIVLACAICIIVPCSVRAQSSVTLYGLIDDGVDYVSNSQGKPLVNMAQSISRFGIRGVEDLGGGLSTVLRLENGFDVNSGKLSQGGLLFGRQAYVGLSSRNLGTLTFGRQIEVVTDYLAPLTAGFQWATTYASHASDVDNFGEGYRSNNTIKYQSSDFRGLTFGGAYSVGGVAGNMTENQEWSLGLKYGQGPFSFAVAYTNARTPSNANALMGNYTTTSTAYVVTTPIYAGFMSANTYQDFGVGVNYRIGDATLGLTYSNVKFLNLGANGPTAFQRGASATFNDAEVNFNYRLQPDLVAGVAFNYTAVGAVPTVGTSSGEGAKYFQGEAGVRYLLSKRTNVYLVVISQKASGVNSLNKSATASLNLFAGSATDRQTLVRVGMTHRF